MLVLWFFGVFIIGIGIVLVGQVGVQDVVVFFFNMDCIYLVWVQNGMVLV